jgi:hypothetical protein
MANQISPGRDGSMTVYSDTYALHGELIVGPPTVAEDPSKWHPVIVEEAEVCKRYNATPDDLMAWRQFKFPTPRTKQIASRFSWWTKVKRSYVEEDLDRWDDSIRDLAARLPKK